jgi:ring-1,2-phenylacetyl-CoA epoxidase subunit PaaC
MTQDQALFIYLLRLGDNALINAQRLVEWLGCGPTLEEEVALANLALDHLGQARFLLDYAGEVEGEERDADQLAFLRDGWDFRNLLLLELPNGDFAHTIVRQFLFATWTVELWGELQASADERLAAIAAKALKEASYHRQHVTDWLMRLGDGTSESRARTWAALDGLWMYTGELFEVDPAEEMLVAAGMHPLLAEMQFLQRSHPGARW